MLTRLIKSIASFNEPLVHFAMLLLRVLMGLGIAYHGFGKVSGGVPDFAVGVASLGFPAPLLFAWLAALSEFLGGIFIVFGFLTRPAALMVFITMSVAAFLMHASDPFNVKELALLYWSVALFFILAGGGHLSIDGIISIRRK